MGYVDFIRYMDARRPLVFLCGPAISNEKTDRRCALRGYILSNWKRIVEKDTDKYLHAFPIIIEKLFDLDKSEENYPEIRINVLEEIVANISYKTYIFLDTLSTSYELGQFTNFAYNSSNTSILVDEQYGDRSNNRIGSYIQKSFSGQLLEYPASYDAQGHIYFPKNRKGHYPPPKKLKDLLEKDNPVLCSENFYKQIVFSKDDSAINQFGCIIYHRESDSISFSFNIKNLFYFISSVYRRVKAMPNGIKLSEIPTSKSDPLFSNFIEKVKKELLTTFVITSQNQRNYCFLLSKDFKISINVGNLDSDELIYHILYMSHLLQTSSGKFGYVVPKNAGNREGISFPNSELDMFNVKNSHLTNLLNKHSVSNNNGGVRKKTIVARSKTRNIICYSDNHLGRQLRYLHNEINDSLLAFLPSSNSSFAYKKGLNTLKCVSSHEGNIYFVKFDIHHFFESISLSRFKAKIVDFIRTQYSKRFNRMHLFSFSRIQTTIGKEVSSIIRPLFYNYRLPIGFINSPKVSDFYLYDLDEQMNTIEGITYTRYADDILISSNDPKKLEEAKSALLKLIEKENLKINESKTRTGVLRNSGDSFKFLGINLVYRGNCAFEYTISKKYLIETSKMCCAFFDSSKNNREQEDLEILKGRLLYIKSISKKSFDYLDKIIRIKTNNRYGISDAFHHYTIRF